MPFLYNNPYFFLTTGNKTQYKDTFTNLQEKKYLTGLTCTEIFLNIQCHLWLYLPFSHNYHSGMQATIMNNKWTVSGILLEHTFIL